MAVKTAAKGDKNGSVATQATAMKETGRIFRIVRGRPCLFCGGPAYMATLGPGRPQVRCCDSAWVVESMRQKIKGFESEIKRLLNERDDAMFAGWEFEDVMSKNDSKAAKKFLGLKDKATDEELVEAVTRKKSAIDQIIFEKEKAVAEEIPGKDEEITKLERRVARTNEFCQAIMGWRDDRIVKRPEQEFAAAS